MKKNSPTEAGRTSKAKYSEAHVDAINQAFALLELNYHNQFFKAFNNQTNLNTIKRFWLETLGRYSPTTILRATRDVIEGSEYLPTLHTMIEACEKFSDRGFPDVHAAYVEACRAPSPKAEYRWSHLAVYYAGQASDWYFLQSNSEAVAFPIYKKHYEEIKQRVSQGETLKPPAVAKISDGIEQPVSKQQAREKLAALRESLKL